MDDAPADQPITDYHIAIVQGLGPYLSDSSRIAKALAQWPAIIEDAIPALHAAQKSPLLPSLPNEFKEAPIASAVPRIQLIRSFFRRQELWVRSGYTHSQLDKFRIAFMDAIGQHVSRDQKREAKQFEASHAERLARQTLNRKLEGRRN